MNEERPKVYTVSRFATIPMKLARIIERRRGAGRDTAWLRRLHLAMCMLMVLPQHIKTFPRPWDKPGTR